MNRKDGRSVRVGELNERRHRAVKLQLAGASVAEAASRTRLSEPTVARALKAYQEGGWAAVPVGPRGRGVRKQAVSAAPRIVHVLACGSPGAGRRTLIGRLARESKIEFQDPLDALASGSGADAALVLVDARHGIVAQTRHQSYLLALLGVRRVALAVNKMDLAKFSAQRYRAIEAGYREFAARIGLASVTAIPVSARRGDNLAARSTRMPWYRGPTLARWLAAGEATGERLRRLPLRLPVESVEGAERGCRGTVASGALRRGERVRIQPSGRETSVERIVAGGREVDEALAGERVALALAEPAALSPGDLVAAAAAPAEVADSFEATVVWTGGKPLLRGRSYLMKLGAASVPATIAPLKYKINVETLEHLAAEKLEKDEIGVCEIELDRPVPFDPYRANPATGGFSLVDRISNAAVGAGMLNFALRRAHNIHRQHLDVDKAARSALLGHRPCVLWMTGLSGAGKSTIANLVEKRLHALGCHTYALDGDNVRHGLNKDLGFTAEDRVENIRRVAEVAKLMVDAGLIVITAFISPFRAERQMARALFAPGEFLEVFIDTPLAVAERRDPKGLYKKARRGEIKNFTGIDSPFEAPREMEIHLDTGMVPAERSAERIVSELGRRGLIPA